MSISQLLRWFIVLVTLSGCALRPVSDGVASPESGKLLPAWLQAFPDPLVPVLAPQVLNRNYDLAVIAAQVQEGRALARAARAQLWPSLTATGQGYRGNDLMGNPLLTTLGSVGGDLAWEVDLFGATAARARARERALAALQFSAQQLELLVVADLLTAIVEWRQGQTTIREVTRLLATQQEQVNLIRSRVEGGLLDAASLERAEAQRLQTASRLPLARALADTSQYRIESLTGQLPFALSAVLNANATTDLSPPDITSLLQLPVASLRHRPDVQAAFEALQAAEAEVAATEADLWPRLSIGAFFGARDTSIDLARAANPIWSVAPAITVPILNFGRLRAQVAAADARAQAALARYEQTVIRAAQEVETALAAARHGMTALTLLQDSVTRRRETVAVLTERFRRGLIDMVALTTAQAELDQATLAVIEQTAAVNVAAITAHRAVVVTPQVHAG